ncbi:iron chelate uptake ABC transporter family permease subunit [Wukongibacter sp. M2B1]|uniref:iron chelate uptake ABC transporter family permease subunit n=1 Tax=Wukongibacter sp. M2B1 TaxID=3088895 RepID=UPI003D7ABA4F
MLRVVLGMLTGIRISISGTVMQSITRNPLVLFLTLFYYLWHVHFLFNLSI